MVRLKFPITASDFHPAPGPLEMTEQPAQINQMTILETKPLEKMMSRKG